MSSFTSWLEFLQTNRLQLVDGELMATSERAASANTNTRLFALTNMCTLQIEGEEAKKFLQGQVTCDINNLSDYSAQYGAHCNAKGRVIFNFLACAKDDKVTLRCDASLEDVARKSLGKYMVFSKAKYVPDSDIKLCIALKGDTCENIVSDIFGKAPSTFMESIHSDDFTLIRTDDDVIECWVSADKIEDYWLKLEPLCAIGATSEWRADEIRKGRVWINADTTENFVPQTINLTQVGAVSFTKGCYTGQEVVARMQYLGKQKRHTYRAIADIETIPKAGDKLFGEDTQQSIGEIVNVVPTDDFSYELLVCILDSAYKSGEVYLESQKVTKLRFAPLPYAITNEQEETSEA